MASHDNNYAPSMPETVSVWWTEERVEATICPEFVRAQLSIPQQDRLEETLAFGDGLTDDTYLERVLTKARRFFLILVEIGTPDQIFGIVDESYDDDDLPLTQEAASQLRFTRQGDQSLAQKFYNAQFRFLVTGVREGEHVRYGSKDVVPIEVATSRLAMPGSNKDLYDKVWLPGAATRTYVRRRVSLDKDPDYFQETEVLEDVVTLKKLAHQHLLSVFGSYTAARSVFVLFAPAPEITLKTFLNDQPANFKNLEKKDRRQILVNWPHCLASALSWLHQQGFGHGSVTPSNVLIDTSHNIMLGHFNACQTLHADMQIDDIESYQYAPPERWIRTAVVHQNLAAKPSTYSSGGRTGRRAPKGKSSTGSGSTGSGSIRSPSAMGSHWSQDLPTSPASPLPNEGGKRAGPVVFNLTADGLRSSSRTQAFQSAVPSSSGGSFISSASASSGHGSQYQTPASSAASIISSTSSETRTAFRVPIDLDKFRRPSNASSSSGATTKPSTHSSSGLHSGLLNVNVSVAAASSNQAIVQTWHSHEVNAMPADIFALATVTLDIMTHLCKRKISAFANHRSAKNRTAGRGGGLADASFHANLGQVASWIDILDHDAAKKSDLVFKALPPMLAILKDMIAKDPSQRPDVEKVERRFEDAIWKVSQVAHLHCRGERPVKVKKEKSKSRPRVQIQKPVLPQLRESVTAPLSPFSPSEGLAQGQAHGASFLAEPSAATASVSRPATSISQRSRSPSVDPSQRHGMFIPAQISDRSSSLANRFPHPPGQDEFLHSSVSTPNIAPSPLSKFDFDYDFQLDDLTEVDQELEFQEQSDGESTLHHTHPVTPPSHPLECPPTPATLPPPYPPPNSKPPTPISIPMPHHDVKIGLPKSAPSPQPGFPPWGMPQAFPPQMYPQQGHPHNVQGYPQGQFPPVMYTAEQVQQMLQQAQQAAGFMQNPYPTPNFYPPQGFPAGGYNNVPHQPPRYASPMPVHSEYLEQPYSHHQRQPISANNRTPDLSRQDSYNADSEREIGGDSDDDDDFSPQNGHSLARRMGDMSITPSISTGVRNAPVVAKPAPPKPVLQVGGGRTKVRVKQPKPEKEAVPKRETAGGIPAGMKSFSLFSKKK